MPTVVRESIEFIDTKGQEIGQAGITALENCIKKPLHFLSIRGCVSGAAVDVSSLYNRLEALPSFHKLDMGCLQLDEKALVATAQLLQKRVLRILNIRYDRVVDGKAQLLFTEIAKSNVKELNCGCFFVEEGGNLDACFKELKDSSLSILNMTSSQISSANVLSSLPKTIRTLTADFLPKITDTGKHMAELFAKAAQLKSAYFRFCSLTDEDLLAFADALFAHEYLQEIFLCGNDFTVEGINSFCNKLRTRTKPIKITLQSLPKLTDDDRNSVTASMEDVPHIQIDLSINLFYEPW